MKFSKNKYYIVECVDIDTHAFQRWHLNFVPNHKAYKILNDNIYLNNIYKDKFYITNVIDVFKCAKFTFNKDNVVINVPNTLASSALKFSKYPLLSTFLNLDSITNRELIKLQELLLTLHNESDKEESEIEEKYDNDFEINYYKTCPQCGNAINTRCYVCGFDWESL